MIRKLLFTLFLLITSICFSQEKTIENLSTAPNPFTRKTNITFKTAKKSTITLLVKNVLGKTVFKKDYQTKIGINTIPFYKNDLSVGIYIYSIQNKKSIISKRLVIQ